MTRRVSLITARYATFNKHSINQLSIIDNRSQCCSHALIIQLSLLLSGLSYWLVDNFDGYLFHNIVCIGQ